MTDERLAKRIAKTGIKPSEIWNGEEYVFATPVLENFMVSHQWVRELKRRGIRTIAAVQFRIPDEEQVRVGHYGQEPLDTTAVGAIRVFREHTSGLGLQVMIPRKITSSEIMRVYTPSQGVGWRYYPEAKGRKPCGCEACQRGEIKSRRIREAYESG
ncbi:hypothetical protein [Opitutus sp. ER46]|uniref:hypothetical protein n=1 Tax=Opitutus sp. ER46 TaxID=2161864 RepID=UPI0018EE984C|nr:hypothetical protein [Opitutus sp. ER46]